MLCYMFFFCSMFFFFKQKTAYEMRISDWSSDVCSSDLPQDFETALAQLESLVSQVESGTLPLDQSLTAYEQGVELAKICQRRLDQAEQQVKEIGRASCRERVCQYV